MSEPANESPPEHVDSNPARAWSGRRHLLAVLALTAVAAGPRLYRLDTPGMWYDEIRTIYGALSGREGVSKALGYLPQRFWLRAEGVDTSADLAERIEDWREAGIDEWSARAPSAWIGVLTVPILYLAGAAVLGPGVAFAASLTLALAVWHVYWSQTARFYAIQFLFYNLSLLMFLRWRRTHRMGHVVVSMAALVLAALSQPTAVVLYGVFLTAAVFEVFVTGRGSGARRVLLTLLAPALLVGLAIGVDVFRGPDRWLHFFEKANLPPGRLITSGAYYIGPVVVMMALIGAMQAWCRRDRTQLAMAIAAALPFAAFSIVGLFGRVELRYCLVALYAWIVLAASAAMAGLNALRARAANRDGLRRPDGSPTPDGSWVWPGVALAPVVCIVAAQLAPLYDYVKAGGWRPEIPQAVAYVQSNMTADDTLYMNPDEGRYYFRRKVTGDAPEIDQATPDRGAWVVYRKDFRGTLPPPEAWVEKNTQLRAVFGRDGIARMARVYVRYKPRGRPRAGE